MTDDNPTSDVLSLSSRVIVADYGDCACADTSGPYDDDVIQSTGNHYPEDQQQQSQSDDVTADDDYDDDDRPPDVDFRLLRAYRKRKKKRTRDRSADDDGDAAIRTEKRRRRRKDNCSQSVVVVTNNHQRHYGGRHIGDVIDDKSPAKSSPDIYDDDGDVGAVDQEIAEAMLMNRKRMCINCCKRFSAFLLSTVGLSLLTVAYSIVGGFLFSAVEAPYERRVKIGVSEALRSHVAALWEATDRLNVLHPVCNNYMK